MDHLIISCEGIVTLPPFALLSLFSPSPLSENGIGILFAFQIAFFLLVCKCAKLLMEMNVFPPELLTCPLYPVHLFSYEDMVEISILNWTQLHI